MNFFDKTLIRFLCLALLLVVPAAVGAEPAKEPRFGRTFCYDDAGFIMACPVNLDGDEMELDLPFRFRDNGDDTVKDELLGLDWSKGENGSIRLWVVKREPRFIDHDDGTMVDIDTGLVWLRDANCIASTYPVFDKIEREEDGRVSWKMAQLFIRRLNEGRYAACNAGYTDWRLPNLGELMSLVVDEGELVKAALLEQGFINVVPVYYWSSTENLANIYFAWAVSMQNGRVSNLPKSMGLNIWPVRSPSDTKENGPQEKP